MKAFIKAVIATIVFSILLAIFFGILAWCATKFSATVGIIVCSVIMFFGVLYIAFNYYKDQEI